MRNRSRPSAQSDGIFCHPLPGDITIPNGRLIVGAASWGNVTDLRNALIAVGTCHNAVKECTHRSRDMPWHVC